MGMSAVLGIITAHKGALQLSSHLGHGTTIKVYLPVNSMIVENDPLQKTLLAPWQGSGTILLVEDEPQIRQVAKLMLKKHGFNVIEASNGKEALELYNRNATEIACVVTDMGMPVMDGYSLFRELKILKPELPIIISSGFGDAEIIFKIPLEEIAGFVNKPYNPDRLREVLKGVFERADSNPKNAVYCS